MRAALARALRRLADLAEPPAAARNRAVAAEQQGWTPPSLRVLPGRALLDGEPYQPRNAPCVLRPVFGHGASEGDPDL